MPHKACSDGPSGDPRAGRIPLPDVSELSAHQRVVYDEIVTGPRGKMIGPLRAVIHNPELAARWSRLGEYVRYQTSIPARYGELAIIATSRRWSSPLEWAIHSGIARAEGVPEEVIEAIRTGRSPVFAEQDEADIYEFVRQLQQTGYVDAGLYGRVGARWGDVGLVELAAIVGYYTMVAVTLNAHLVPVPDDESSTLDVHMGDGLYALPPAICVVRDLP